MISKVVHFVITTGKHIHQHSYPPSAIGNMDETPLWLHMPGDTTITRSNVRSVLIRTTRHEKGRFTVSLAAMADGQKLKPFLVFKGVPPIPELNRVQGVIVSLRRNGWMNEQLTKDWVNRVSSQLGFDRRLLVWDSYMCRIMDSVKTSITGRCNSDISVIPGGLTKHLQPANMCWNKHFKEAYRVSYDEWMTSGEKPYTPAGNMRPPTKMQVLQWVKLSVTEYVVKNHSESVE